MKAPVVLVCVADAGVRIPDENFNADDDSPEAEVKMIIRDTSITVEHIVLEAEQQGLGTCWISWFRQEEIRPVLSIPNNKFVVAVLPLYSALKLVKNCFNVNDLFKPYTMPQSL